MQTPDSGDRVRLTFYCKSPDSKTASECPAFHWTDRGTWMVQGDRHEDPQVRA
jgi:hypothetical protein